MINWLNINITYILLIMKRKLAYQITAHEFSQLVRKTRHREDLLGISISSELAQRNLLSEVRKRTRPPAEIPIFATLSQQTALGAADCRGQIRVQLSSADQVVRSDCFDKYRQKRHFSTETFEDDWGAACTTLGTA